MYEGGTGHAPHCLPARERGTDVTDQARGAGESRDHVWSECLLTASYKSEKKIHTHV